MRFLVTTANPIQTILQIIYHCDVQEEHMKGVENIINEASLFENPEEVRRQQHFRDECRKAAMRTSEQDF